MCHSILGTISIPNSTIPIPVLISYRSDDSDVWQVAATSCWVVGHDDITLVNIITEGVHLILHCLLHCSQVHRDVRGIGNQPTIRAKKSTRKVQPFLEETDHTQKK